MTIGTDSALHASDEDGGTAGTSVPGILAVGDVSSPLKMIVTAVAQAAAAAHEAYREIRSPCWK